MAKAQTMSLRNQNRRQDAKASDGLHVPGWLARWPVIGIVMFIVGSLACFAK